jgi:hypothetical protein
VNLFLQKTVKHTFYLQILECSWQYINWKTPILWPDTWILHNDNEPSHTALLVKWFSRGWKQCLNIYCIRLIWPEPCPMAHVAHLPRVFLPPPMWVRGLPILRHSLNPGKSLSSWLRLEQSSVSHEQSVSDSHSGWIMLNWVLSELVQDYASAML